MCAPSSGGKFLRTELMTHNATVDKFSSQAFCRTFLESIIKMFQYMMDGNYTFLSYKVLSLK